MMGPGACPQRQPSIVRIRAGVAGRGGGHNAARAGHCGRLERGHAAGAGARNQLLQIVEGQPADSSDAVARKADQQRIKLRARYVGEAPDSGGMSLRAHGARVAQHAASRKDGQYIM